VNIEHTYYDGQTIFLWAIFRKPPKRSVNLTKPNTPCILYLSTSESGAAFPYGRTVEGLGKKEGVSETVPLVAGS
jgi:hypothetical protein